MVKPCLEMVSSKSMVAPLRYGHAHLVDDDLDAVEVADGVAVEQPLVEVELVDQAGASARLDGNAQAQVGAAFLLEQAADLAGGDVGQLDLVRGQFSPAAAVVSVLFSLVVVLIGLPSYDGPGGSAFTVPAPTQYGMGYSYMLRRSAL